MGQCAIRTHDISPWKLYRRMPKPCSFLMCDRCICDGADSDKIIWRIRKACRDDSVVANKSVVADRGLANENTVAIDTRRCEIDSICEEAGIADRHSIGNDIDDRGDLASLSNSHSCKAKPCWPEERSAQPTSGGFDRL